MTRWWRRGGRPINAPRSWEENGRHRSKEIALKLWFRKGGYDVPLFIPHTPGKELVKRIIEKEAENNQDRRVRFKIVGRGVSPWSRSLGDPTLGQEASVVGKSAFPGKVKVRETAGRKVCVMTCCVTSVG